ncbi:MAG: HAD-IA family hydrolase [Acidimicrobiia bacterium]|nr:HAD-IA family hydrolase [Acidimicrobiia bacterium]
MITAVLFDFGGVILTSPFDAFANYERANDLPSGFLRQVNATNPDTNAWALLERSEVTLEEFAERFEAEAAALGHQVDAFAVLGLLAGELRPAMVAALRRLRGSGRFQLGLLTNNFVTGDGAVGGDRHEQIAEVLALFDEIVESSKVGVRKPDPRFYEMACELLGISPVEAVFLDDLGVNLKPARAMGMTTIKVVDPDVALRELSEVVGLDLLDEVDGQSSPAG